MSQETDNAKHCSPLLTLAESLRQYRHNNAEGFVAAYEYDGTRKAFNELRQQLADVSHERDLLRAAVRWVPVSERLPLQPIDGQSFECVEVVVTDGTHVHVTDFKAGGIPVAWSEFDGYAAISRSQPTHWMPLPAAPSAEVKS